MRSSTLLSLLALLAPLVASGANNDTTRCYSITSNDRRTACLAESKNSRSGCAAIRDHDKRAMCDAKTSGNKTSCYSVRNNDLRQACLAGMSY